MLLIALSEAESNFHAKCSEFDANKNGGLKLDRPKVWSDQPDVCDYLVIILSTIFLKNNKKNNSHFKLRKFSQITMCSRYLASAALLFQGFEATAYVGSPGASSISSVGRNQVSSRSLKLESGKRIVNEDTTTLGSLIVPSLGIGTISWSSDKRKISQSSILLILTQLMLTFWLV